MRQSIATVYRDKKPLTPCEILENFMTFLTGCDCRSIMPRKYNYDIRIYMRNQAVLKTSSGDVNTNVVTVIDKRLPRFA